MVYQFRFLGLLLCVSVQTRDGSEGLLWYGNGIHPSLEIERCQTLYWNARANGWPWVWRDFFSFARLLFPPFILVVKKVFFPLFSLGLKNARKMRQHALTRHQLGTRSIHDVIEILHSGLWLVKNAAFLTRWVRTTFG